ncbi:IDEAL domain-containing protein [Clostridium sp. LBM24168]
MKGELLNYNDIKNLEDNSKVWVIWRHQSSDVYTIKKLQYGVDFIKYYSPNHWLSFFMTYTALEYSVNNNIARVYEWISNEEYIKNRLLIVKKAIDISLDKNDKEKFMRLSKEYNSLLEQKRTIE